MNYIDVSFNLFDKNCINSIENLEIDSKNIDFIISEIINSYDVNIWKYEFSLFNAFNVEDPILEQNFVETSLFNLREDFTRGDYFRVKEYYFFLKCLKLMKEFWCIKPTIHLEVEIFNNLYKYNESFKNIVEKRDHFSLINGLYNQDYLREYRVIEKSLIDNLYKYISKTFNTNKKQTKGLLLFRDLITNANDHNVIVVKYLN